MNYADITLQRGGAIPLYRQIAAAIRDAIASGEIPFGARLPPIRALAHMLHVSQVTTAQAYDLLIAGGDIASHVGRGTFVLERSANRDPAPIEPTGASSLSSAAAFGQPELARADLWTRGLSIEVRATRAQAVYTVLDQIIQRTPHTQDLIHFSRAIPDPALFPMRRWRHSMRLAADHFLSEDRASAQYGPALGDPLLRAFVATALRRYGIEAEPEEILLTSGTQQSLDLIARTFVKQDETVFVEEVSYIAALDIFEQRPVVWQSLPVDEQGMQVEALSALAGVASARPRLLYTIPTGQSPTGHSMSGARRQLLVEMAERYNLLVIADEAFCELYLDGQAPVPAVQSFAKTGRVMSLLSFSKTIFPGVRMGCIVAARPLIELLAQTKGIFDREAALPLERAVLQHISTAAYARELTHSREQYRSRRDYLLELLHGELAALSCRWTVPAAGFSLLVSLPPGCEEMAVVEEAAWQGLIILPGQCFAPIPTTLWHNSLRLSYGDLSPEMLRDGVHRLARAIQVNQGSHAKSSNRGPLPNPL